MNYNTAKQEDFYAKNINWEEYDIYFSYAAIYLHKLLVHNIISNSIWDKFPFDFSEKKRKELEMSFHRAMTQKTMKFFQNKSRADNKEDNEDNEDSISSSLTYILISYDELCDGKILKGEEELKNFLSMRHIVLHIAYMLNYNVLEAFLSCTLLAILSNNINKFFEIIQTNSHQNKMLDYMPGTNENDKESIMKKFGNIQFYQKIDYFKELLKYDFSNIDTRLISNEGKSERNKISHKLKALEDMRVERCISNKYKNSQDKINRLFKETFYMITKIRDETRNKFKEA